MPEVNYVTLNGHQIRINGKVQERQVNPWAARITSGPPDFGSYSACEVREWNDFRGGIGIERESTPSDRIYESSAETEKKGYIVETLAGQSAHPVAINCSYKLFCDFEGVTYLFGDLVSRYYNNSYLPIADGAPLATPTDVLTMKDTTDNYLITCNGSAIRYSATGYDTSPTPLYTGGTWTASADTPTDVVCSEYAGIIGSTSTLMACTATLGIENIAYYNTGTLDISAKKYVTMWINSSVALAANDLQLVLATDVALGGTTELENIPAVAANAWKLVSVPITTPATFSALKSIGIKRAAGAGAFSLWIDYTAAITTAGWGVLSTSAVKYMCVFDRRLFGVTSDGGTLFYSPQDNCDAAAGGAIADSIPLSGPWTTAYDLFTGLLPNTSTEVIFMVTDVGLVWIDYVTKTCDLMDIRITKPPATVPMIGMYYNGEIYVTYGPGIKKISSGGIVTEWGPNQDDGLPSSYQGNITSMVFTPNHVVINLGSNIWKRHNTVGGWHYVGTNGWGPIHYSTIGAVNKLWKSTDGANYISYCPFLDTTQEITGTSTYGFSMATLTFPWWCPVESIPKIALGVRAIVANCDTNNYLTISYRIDNDVSFTTLGSFKSSPNPATLLFASGAGISFFSIQPKVTFDTSSPHTTSPVLRSLLLSYIINPSYIGGWTFNVSAEGQDAKQVVTWLTAARDASTLVQFSPIGNTAQESYYVKVQQCPSKFDAISPSPNKALTVMVAEVV